ncbi:MAG: D-aminoacylase [Bacillota bacterium]|nr:D-aminoacylase [Bacillota bacterium]
MFDLLILGGTVIDGTGKPRYRGDVGVTGGRVDAVGDLSGAEAHEVIDAKGMIVAPGFIDPHSHSEPAFFDPKVPELKLRQGITTEIVQHCGGGLSPVTEANIGHLSDVVKNEDGTPRWTSLGGLIDALDDRPLTVNVGFLVPHGTLRAAVLAMDNRAPDAEEMAQMERLLAREVDEGALGMSSGLVYLPGCFAKTDEIINLCRHLAASGGVYCPHMRNEGYHLEEGINESLTIVEKSGAALQVVHLKALGKDNWHKTPAVIAMLDAARARGLRVTADQYPYVAGSGGLTTVLPRWAMAGGIEAMLDRLRDPEIRAKIRAEYDLEATAWDNRGKSLGWENMVVASVHTTKNRSLEGKSLQQIARERGRDEALAVFDLLLEEDGKVGLINYFGCEESIEQFMKVPYVAVCTDAGVPVGSSAHPRGFGAMPRVLGRYVRERGVISLEEAVRKMTSLPSATFGLGDRGVLQRSAPADIVVFDPDRVIDNSTFADPYPYPSGIEFVVVNGEVEIRGGEFTGKTAGQVLTR